MSKPRDESIPRIVIVGAGLGGISAAIALKKQLGFTNFTIYESSDRVGGTWRDNTYPGCGCDIPVHWYSLSTELNPNWTSFFAEQPEIRNYWEGLFTKYNLHEQTQFNAKVIASEWDETFQGYKISVQDVITGMTTYTEAEVMIYAIGGFFSPLFPKDLDTISNFRGSTWHSARWRHDIDLKGKRVGVIGNGCSAAQFIPRIASDPSVTVINFCRTPQWFTPRVNMRYPSWTKWIFANIPFVLRWYRNWIFMRADFVYLVFQKSHPLIGSLLKGLLTRYIKSKAPKDQWNNLIPKYPPGCKRFIVDPGYLECLHQPNVTVNWHGIDCFVEEGIKLKTGELVPLDVIIFGTGFSLDPVDLRVRGRHGDLQSVYAAKGGPEAYLGCCTSGFPNLYTILGPNVASGHASVIFSEEVQIDLAMRMIRPIVKGEVKSFEIKEKFANYYNIWLQGALSKTVWMDCNSYYRRNGKNIATFPGPVALQWWIAKTDRWDNWIVVGGKTWASRRKTTRTKMSWVAVVLLLAVVGALRNARRL